MDFKDHNKYDQKFPCVTDMQAAARRRIPKFALDYLEGAIGRNVARDRNRSILDCIRFQPRYLTDQANNPECGVELLGKSYTAPFGVAPIGLGGLLWPRAAEYLAAAAAQNDIPFVLSGFATSSVEDINQVSSGDRWYQHYVCHDENIDGDLLKRARACGFSTLVITVDIPTATRRDHDIRNGVAIPPRKDWRTFWAAARCPAWSVATLANGLPEFRCLMPYVPADYNLKQTTEWMTNRIEGHVDLNLLRWFRRQWDGPMLVKGIMSSEEALLCQAEGIDGVIVSNHGGRQLDASQAAVEVLPAIRDAVGKGYPVVADGGIRNGLDIARVLAKGADFVLLGRPFIYAVAAMGQPGADHVMNILRQEFRITLSQIGCPDVNSLSDFLVRDS